MSAIQIEMLDTTQLREVWKFMSGKASKASQKTLIGYIRKAIIQGSRLPTYEEVFGVKEIEIEEFGLPTIEQNTNLLGLKSKDLVVFLAEDCEPWLSTILKTKRLFGGAEGDIHAYDDKFVKSEFYAGKAEYSIIFMNKLNHFLDDGFPHFLRTYMVYKCESNKGKSDKLITFMEKGGESLSERKKTMSKDELISIFVQVLMIFTLFFYRGMNHFDLHDGNVIIDKTSYQKITYNFGHKTISIPTYGHLAKIIDFGNVGFMLNDGRIELSFPESPKGRPDYRKSPFSFYYTGLDLFVGDFPYVPEKSAFLKEWREIDLLMYNETGIKEYKRNTSSHLFDKIKEYYDFRDIKGKTKTIKIEDVGGVRRK